MGLLSTFYVYCFVDRPHQVNEIARFLLKTRWGGRYSYAEFLIYNEMRCVGMKGSLSPFRSDASQIGYLLLILCILTLRRHAHLCNPYVKKNLKNINKKSKIL